MSRRRLNRLLGRAMGDCAVCIFPQAGHHLRSLSARTFLVTTSMSMTVCPTEPTGLFDSRAPVREHAFWSTSYDSSAVLSGSDRNSLTVGRPSSPGFGPPLWGRDSGVNPPFFPFPFFPAAPPFFPAAPPFFPAAPPFFPAAPPFFPSPGPSFFARPRPLLSIPSISDTKAAFVLRASASSDFAASAYLMAAARPATACFLPRDRRPMRSSRSASCFFRYSF